MVFMIIFEAFSVVNIFSGIICKNPDDSQAAVDDRVCINGSILPIVLFVMVQYGPMFAVACKRCTARSPSLGRNKYFLSYPALWIFLAFLLFFCDSAAAMGGKGAAGFESPSSAIKVTSALKKTVAATGAVGAAVVASLDPAQTVAAILKIFTTHKKFSGKNDKQNDARVDFESFKELLLITVANWNYVATALGYRLVDVFTKAPDPTDQDGVELCKIIFRTLILLTEGYARRYVARTKNEDGYLAWRDLSLKYTVQTINTVAYYQTKLEEWRIPPPSRDPQESFIDVFDWWDKLEVFGIETAPYPRVLYVVSKMRKNKAYASLPHLWGGLHLETFLQDMTAEILERKIYDFWE
jgi:hypothetical protein